MGHTLDPTLIPIWIRFIPTYVGHILSTSMITRAESVHPHLRGAYGYSNRVWKCPFGSSPHTWGIQHLYLCCIQIYRFIPTYVGHTISRPLSVTVRSVHPHIRGAYLVPGHPRAGPKRFIPTYVGHTCTLRFTVGQMPVHPHIRGAYRRHHGGDPDCPGSSPHTWGIRSPPANPPQSQAVHPHIRGAYVSKLKLSNSARRFIPTYVGHTPVPGARNIRQTVHPHIRGAYATLGCG